ncbi:TonB-dependent receptor plug domain-containing protein [Niabella sp. W65]|nr:TonB-dependent receptor plug domain-containing protein [Niabella sp. W65]MCH7364088.1 TonB-dependent receptor plug domain-containing protein [Niabella sp. W65]ULT39965.1 TonB-dependent receptor plug domain-containing protein [Niabella sp. I65]
MVTITTDSNGNFELPKGYAKGRILVSYVGHSPFEAEVDDDAIITLYQTNSQLDETVVIAYGTTTKRLNTGNVATITSKEIESQPVSNPLAALIGRVPGVDIVQSSGVAGSSFSVQIRVGILLHKVQNHFL